MHRASPTRARSARVRCFRLFAFTASPFGDKQLWYKGLRVKVSLDLPSPVKAKKRTNLHPQVANYQRVRGEGKNCELAECAMRGRASAEAHLHTRENGERNTTEGGEWEESRRVARKRREERRKRRRVSQESPQVFIFTAFHFEKTKLFLTKTGLRVKYTPEIGFNLLKFIPL